MRVHPSRYAAQAGLLKSSAVEGSLNGQRWTDIDRQTNKLKEWSGWNTPSSGVSQSAESRFIRLTQIDENHTGRNCLELRAVEFLGTLSE
jgi:hypothetical protein